MLQELTVRDGADRMETVLAWYLDAFPEFELSQYPIRLSPAHFEHPVEKDPNPSPLLSRVPIVPMDDEGYDAEPEDIWAGGEGYDVWGAYEPEDSSDPESVRSAINVVELPEMIMLSSDETDDGNLNKGSTEEDTWSFRSKTSNSSDPDFTQRKRRGRKK